MQEKQKLDDLIEEDPRHNIFVLLLINLFLGGLGVFSFYKIIEEIISLF